MGYSLLALLADGAPEISIDSLAHDLENFFRNEKDFLINFEMLPFKKNKSLVLRWGNWVTRIAYEEGEKVQKASTEIQQIIGLAVVGDISNVDKRIRVVFRDDASREYTNQIIYVIDFLRAIDGIVIFDPRNGDVLKF